MKIITFITAVLPLLLPLHNVSTGIYYIVALYYFGVCLMLLITVKEGIQP